MPFLWWNPSLRGRQACPEPVVLEGCAASLASTQSFFVSSLSGRQINRKLRNVSLLLASDVAELLLD